MEKINGKAQFLAVLDTVEKYLEHGYSLRRIYSDLTRAEKVTISYSQFARHADSCKKHPKQIQKTQHEPVPVSTRVTSNRASPAPVVSASVTSDTEKTAPAFLIGKRLSPEQQASSPGGENVATNQRPQNNSAKIASKEPSRFIRHSKGEKR